MTTFHIHCGCTYPNVADTEASAQYSETAAYTLFPLENMQFCEDCFQVRCPRCTVEEIVCVYCPTCLEEIAPGSSRAQAGVCAKNCFRCPVCYTSLGIAERRGRYDLTCSHCLWSTGQSSTGFRKTSSFTRQYASESISPIRDCYARMDAKISHFKKMTRYFVEKDGAMLRTTSSQSFPNRPLNASLQHVLGDSADVSPLVDDLPCSEETFPTSQQVKLTTFRAALEQPLPTNRNSGLLPLLQKLRTKRAKRCRACRHILVKPDSKATSTRFRIKLLASAYLPNISAVSIDHAEQRGISQRLLRRFIITVTNPLYDTINVTLSTARKASAHGSTAVTIVCPAFEVSATVDPWEQSRSREQNRHEGDYLSHEERLERALAGGLWSCGKGWVSILLEMILQNPKKRELLHIPIFVSVVYNNGNNEETGTENSPTRKEWELGFWSLLKLGNI